MSTYERLIAVIRAFVEAESWGESREIVERHQELLTTDVGAALETFARNAEEAGDADMARTFPRSPCAPAALRGGRHGRGVPGVGRASRWAATGSGPGDSARGVD